MSVTRVVRWNPGCHFIRRRSNGVVGVPSVRLLVLAAFLFMPVSIVTAQDEARAARLRQLVDQLQSETEQHRIDAAEKIAELRADAYHAIPALKYSFEHDPSVAVRRKTLLALGALAPHSKSALPLILKAVDDADAQIAGSALSSLTLYGKEASFAVPRLLEILNNPKDHFRWATAIRSLRSIGPGSAEALPRLLELARTEDDELTRGGAVASLGAIGGDRRDVRDVLRHYLQPEEPTTMRFYAVQSVYEAGLPAKDLFPDAKRFLLEGPFPNIPVKRQALADYARLLERLEMPETTDFYLSALKSPEMDRVHHAALHYFENKGAKITEHLVFFVELLEDPKNKAGDMLKTVFRNLGEDGIPFLITILKDDGRPTSVRMRASHILRSMKVARAIPIYTRLRSSRNLDIRLEAERALRELLRPTNVEKQ